MSRGRGARVIEPGAKRITIKQVRSGIGFPETQKRILFALGLERPGRARSFPDTPSVRGMAAKISHLVEIVDP